MNIIPNELKYAESCLKNNEIDQKNGKTLVVLTKYFYHHKKISFNEIKHALLDFLSNVNHTYNIDNIDGLINKYAKDNVKLSNVDEIHITKSEIDMIEKNDDKDQRRILFSMLVSYKVKNEIYKYNNCKINEPETVIFNDAKVRKTKKQRDMMLADLQEKGYIAISNSTIDTRITLNYVDDTSENAILITSFCDFIFDYYIYIGKKIIVCEECETRFESKSRTKTEKYCKTCKSKKQVEWEKKSRNKNF